MIAEYLDNPSEVALKNANKYFRSTITVENPKHLRANADERANNHTQNALQEQTWGVFQAMQTAHTRACSAQCPDARIICGRQQTTVRTLLPDTIRSHTYG